MIRTLAFGLLVAMAPAIASADYMLDDFSAAQGNNSSLPITDGEGVMNVTRTFGNVATSDGLNATLIDVAFMAPSGATIQYDYSAAMVGMMPMTSINPNANLVVFRGASSAAGGTISLQTTSTGGITSSVQRGVLAGTAGQDLFLNITSLSNIQQTQSLLFTFDSTLGGQFQFGAIDFVSVPEPASIALAGLAVSSIGGAGLFRRRRQVADATHAV